MSTPSRRWRGLAGLPARLAAQTTTRDLGDVVRLLLETANVALFRGQADASWALQTRLNRTFPHDTLMNERRMYQIFRADAPAMLDARFVPHSRVAWYATMQHYGAPTRLLDWTSSPFVALFFACESEPTVDGSLWLLDKQWCIEATLEVVGGYDSNLRQWQGDAESVIDAIFEHHYPAFLPVTTFPRFARVAAQEGSFTLVGGESADVTAALLALDGARLTSSRALLSDAPLKKIVIPKTLKQQALEVLAAMRINHATIYPDLEGLTRSLPHREWLDWYQA